MTLRFRLYSSNLLYIVLLVIVAGMYFSAGALIDDMKSQQAKSSDLAAKIRSTAKVVDNYLKGSAKFDQARESFDSLLRATGDTPLAKGLKDFWEKVAQYKKLQERNQQIEGKIDELTTAAISQSNGFIKMISEKLAGETTRSSVSKLERLTIAGANINTSANYELMIRFLKLKVDPAQKSAILGYLDTLIANVEKDVKRLADTPFAKMPVAARNAILKMKELIQEYIASSAKQAAIKANLAKYIAGTLDELDQQNASLVEGLFSSIKSYLLVIVIVLLAASLVGIAIALFQANSITRTLNRIVGGLREISQDTSRASSQVANASQSLAEATSSQAASLEETSSSMEEMASMTHQNADNAAQADGMMREASGIITSAAGSMADLRQAMDKINAASDETAKIIKTIDEIAFQTNLLALNAAVEAARAGEAGAGFAVVADEVRNLAMRAAEAARSTSELIESNIKDIKDGSGLVVTTDEAFGKVEQSASKVGELVGEIAAASQEQAQGIEQVNRALTSMDKVTQENAATAEESAASSEELQSQASLMSNLVNELAEVVGSKKQNVQSAPKATAKPAQTKVPAQLKLPEAGAGEKVPGKVVPQGDNDFGEF